MGYKNCCGKNDTKKIVCCNSTIWGYDNIDNYNNTENVEDNYNDDYQYDRGYNRGCECVVKNKVEHRCIVCRFFDCLFGNW